MAYKYYTDEYTQYDNELKDYVVYVDKGTNH